MTLGLFANHVLIEICDGDKVQAAFQSLLEDLHQQFDPVGTLEEWLVARCLTAHHRDVRAVPRVVGAIAMNSTAIVEGLACGTDIAVVFRFVGETLGTEVGTPLAVDTRVRI